jgi:hypothetical protein
MRREVDLNGLKPYRSGADAKRLTEEAYLPDHRRAYPK